MLRDGNFRPEELSAIAFGYTKLLEESNEVLTELKNVVNITTLSMTDKERMDVVERCYSKMKRYRNLVSYYTNKNISVSYLRAKKKNDLDRIMGLSNPNFKLTCQFPRIFCEIHDLLKLCALHRCISIADVFCILCHAAEKSYILLFCHLDRIIMRFIL